MKIGTDGVLLGAWTPLENNPVTVLDIGTGTGLIALMLAQRCVANTIDAIEIDASSYEQCVENFEASAWADRLFCYHASLNEFVEEMDEEYDLIVSNPPFYSEENSGDNASRDLARQNQFLPFETLIKGAANLLSPQGFFSIIIPFKEEASIIEMAANNGLFPMQITRVRGNPNAPIKRSLLNFGRNNFDITYDDLTIEIGRHQYTREYIELTKEFYLKM